MLIRQARPRGTLRAPRPAVFGPAGGNRRARPQERRRARRETASAMADVIENAALPRPIAGVRGNGTWWIPGWGQGKRSLLPNTAVIAEGQGRPIPAFPAREPRLGWTAEGRRGRGPGKAGQRGGHKVWKGAGAEYSRAVTRDV